MMNAPGKPIAVRAIVFVDAVSSTALMHSDEWGTIAELTSRIRAIEDCIGRHGGRVIDRAGDGVLSIFETAGTAMVCVFDLQERWGRDPAARLRFRVGVHVGEIIEIDGFSHGKSIHIAARIEKFAAPGGVCITRAVHDLVCHRVDADFLPLGPTSIRGLPAPVELFIHGGQVGIDSPLPAEAAAERDRDDDPLLYAPEPGIPCVAVLPFGTRGVPRDELYFPQGICSDIIGLLTRFRRLDVIASASAFALGRAEASPDAVRRQLGAGYALYGTMALPGSRVSLSVELVETDTGRLLWRERFDMERDGIFELQKSISETIVTEIAVQIERRERIRARARPPGSLSAYSLCLRGDELMNLLREDACRQAQTFYAEAAKRSPLYARPVASTARTNGFLWKYRWTRNRLEALARARDAAQESVEIDYHDPKAHAELGWVSLYSRDHDAALNCYAQALALNPSDADIIADYADTLKHNGEPEKAIPLFERAIRLNPLNADFYLKDLAHTHLVARDFESAIATVRRMRRPDISRRVLAASLALSGRLDEARIEAERVRTGNPAFCPRDWITMVPDRRPEFSALFLEGMERAGL